MPDGQPTIVIAPGVESSPTLQNESETAQVVADAVTETAQVVAEAVAEAVAESQPETLDNSNAEVLQTLAGMQTQLTELRADFVSLREMVTEEIPDEVPETTEVIVPPEVEMIVDGEPRPNILQRWLL